VQGNACELVAKTQELFFVIVGIHIRQRAKLSPSNQLYYGNIVKAFQKANAKTE
jgi:hypothetical protein